MASPAVSHHSNLKTDVEGPSKRHSTVMMVLETTGKSAGQSIIFLTNPHTYTATLPALNSLTYLKKTHTKYVVCI